MKQAIEKSRTGGYDMSNRILALAGVVGIALLSPGAHASGSGTHSHGHDAAKPAPGHHDAANDIGVPGDPKQVIRTFRLSAGDDNKFRPAAVTVRAGETIKIVLKNEGKLKHELMIGTQAELKEHAAAMAKNPDMEHDDPNAISVQPGKTGELVWKFTKAGEVHFGCLVPGHYEGGMAGKVIVNQ